MNLLMISLLLMAPAEVDEISALEAALANALRAVEPAVVTIETVGGVRHIELPPGAKEKMTVPERPREEKDGPKKEEDPKDEPTPEGQTPRFKDEFRKMLAMPGFQKAEGPTTGVILSEEGYVITSAWNFESRPTVITVTTGDGRTCAARLLGIDRAAGLALLKMDRTGVPAATFLDPGKVEVGAWAFAIGRALDRAPDVKYGIISAKNRIEGNALQTDAATSPSNYGGPLVDLEGRVYGILVPLGARGEDTNPNWYDSGIGFATPVSDPQRLIQRLGKEGLELFPAFLGVACDQDRPGPGALITEIVPDSAASKAGLQKGDLLLAIDGAGIPHAFAVRFEIGRRRSGDKVKLKISREGKEIELEAELDRRPQGEGQPDEKMPVPLPGPGRQPGNPGDPPKPKEEGK